MQLIRTVARGNKTRQVCRGREVRGWDIRVPGTIRWHGQVAPVPFPRGKKPPGQIDWNCGYNPFEVGSFLCCYFRPQLLGVITHDPLHTCCVLLRLPVNYSIFLVYFSCVLFLEILALLISLKISLLSRSNWVVFRALPK